MEPLKDFLYEKFLQVPKKFLWIVGASIIFIFLVLFLLIKGTSNEVEQENYLFDNPQEIGEVEDNSVNSTEETQSEMIMVDVKGAVKNPGVYLCESNERILDVIEKAGGGAKDADFNAVNLSQKLIDEMIVYIPKIGEEQQMMQTMINGVGDGNPGDSLISLNQATKVELESLPGIGSKKAESIISYREANGGFQSIEQLKEIDGIGEKIFEQLKPFVKL